MAFTPPPIDRRDQVFFGPQEPVEPTPRPEVEPAAPIAVDARVLSGTYDAVEQTMTLQIEETTPTGEKVQRKRTYAITSLQVQENGLWNELLGIEQEHRALTIKRVAEALIMGIRDLGNTQTLLATKYNPSVLGVNQTLELSLRGRSFDVLLSSDQLNDDLSVQRQTVNYEMRELQNPNFFGSLLNPGHYRVLLDAHPLCTTADHPLTGRIFEDEALERRVRTFTKNLYQTHGFIHIDALREKYRELSGAKELITPAHDRAVCLLDELLQGNPTVEDYERAVALHEHLERFRNKWMVDLEVLKALLLLDWKFGGALNSPGETALSPSISFEVYKLLHQYNLLDLSAEELTKKLLVIHQTIDEARDDNNALIELISAPVVRPALEREDDAVVPVAAPAVPIAPLVEADEEDTPSRPLAPARRDGLIRADEEHPFAALHVRDEETHEEAPALDGARFYAPSYTGEQLRIFTAAEHHAIAEQHRNALGRRPVYERLLLE